MIKWRCEAVLRPQAQTQGSECLQTLCVVCEQENPRTAIGKDGQQEN